MQANGFVRRSVRIPGFDYSQSGAYFVTICSYERSCLFGTISNFQMEPNAMGQLIIASWNRLASDYPFVSLDTWVLMPNHLHGIIWLGSNNGSRKPLSQVVAAFKAMSTSQVRRAISPNLRVWQRGFFEHVIRNDDDLYRIREYIIANPVNWALDHENPSINLEGACNAPLRG